MWFAPEHAINFAHQETSDPAGGLSAANIGSGEWFASARNTCNGQGTKDEILELPNVLVRLVGEVLHEVDLPVLKRGPVRWHGQELAQIRLGDLEHVVVGQIFGGQSPSQRFSIIHMIADTTPNAT